MRTRLFRSFAVIPLLLLAAIPAAAQRLSTAVIPEHYALWFAPDLEKDVFRGRETIRIQVAMPTRTITLHAAEIEFQSVTIAAAGRTQEARVAIDAREETATLTVSEDVPAGSATIHIAYTGILNDKLRGFYVSRANGRKYAVTQMEATDARRAFPSFDEPMFKATFDVSLMVDVGDTAISNGVQLTDTPGPEPGKHTVTFATTPRMSTYLVAMIVGDFVCRSGASDGTAIRVCSTPDKLDLTAFALQTAEQQLAFYNEYFGITYAFGKLDIVAVPDFAAGAMENSGAIIFRERTLLIDPQRASIGTRKSVASILSHEIAHQWFGNLVTMKWWDDIWLNEGFATWISSKPIARWRPEWKVDLDDAADTQTALGIDALRTTRPIRMRVETPEQINQVFDGIAYEKTAGVLRMLDAWVGPELFRRGIQAYIKKYAFSNAAGEDFWTEMARATGRPIDRIMPGFVTQAGAPVITVRTQCTARTARVTLEQQRFSGTPTAGAPSRELWSVPVCLKTGARTPQCKLFETRRDVLLVEPPEGQACAPVFANADSRGRGYYFTEYEPEAVAAFVRGPTRLNPIERLQLLGDEWWMVRSARHDISVYLDLASALAGDETAAVTDVIASRLALTSAEVVPAADRTRYERWIRERFGPVLALLGVPGPPADDEARNSRRAELLMLVGISGNDVAVQQRAHEAARQNLAGSTNLPGTVVPAVLRLAAFAGDATLYDRYSAQLKTLSAQPEEYYRYFNALTWFRQPELVERTLRFAISPDVRTQDMGALINGLLSRPWSRDAGWTFVKAEWSTLTRLLGTFQGIPGIVNALGGLCSADAAKDVRQFFAKNPVPAAERALQQALERIDNCAALVAHQSPAVTRWLETSSRSRQ